NELMNAGATTRVASLRRGSFLTPELVYPAQPCKIEANQLQVAWADMIDQLATAGETLGKWLWKVANSNFLTALAGAGAGAYGAQWIAERSDRKRRTLEEIRSTNPAIMAAFGIANTYCALKNQHVRRLKETFDRQENDFHAAQQSRLQGRASRQNVFQFTADFQTLQAPATMTGVLQRLLFEKVSITGRALASLATLCQSVDALAEALERRNSIIAHCNANSPWTRTSYCHCTSGY